jgi:F-type H+-transporting ATPase subunit b
MESGSILNLREVAVQIVSFLVLLFLLRKFAWGPLLAFLDGRAQRIAAEEERIQGVRRELGVLQAQYREKLADIDVLAESRIREAREEGRKQAENIQKDAQKEYLQIVANARANVKYEADKAREALKEQVIDLALAAAEHVVQERLTGEQDKRLIDDFLKRMDEVHETHEH